MVLSHRRNLLLALAVFALAACSQGADAPADGAATGTTGAAAPAAGEAMDFTLSDLEGKPVRLADYRGRTVIIDFWATWCPPCEFQVPELNEYWAANAASGEVMVIGVAVDVEGAEVVKPWALEKQVAYQLVLGDESVAREFGAVGFPTLVILRPDGSVHSRHVGLIEAAELAPLVAAAAGVEAI